MDYSIYAKKRKFKNIEEKLESFSKTELMAIVFGSSSDEFSGKAARILIEKSSAVTDSEILLNISRNDMLPETIRKAAAEKVILSVTESESSRKNYLALLELSADRMLPMDSRIKAGENALGAALRLSRVPDSRIMGMGVSELVSISLNESLPGKIREKAGEGISVISEIIERNISSEMMNNYVDFVKSRKRNTGKRKARKKTS